MKNITSYGSWKSPITPEFVSGKDSTLTPSIQCDGEHIYFIESRPDEAGRSVLMRLKADGSAHEVLPSDFNVRTQYLEYSGLSFLVCDGTVYFTEYSDQQVYVAEPGQSPRQITNEKENRFADFCLDKKRRRLLAVREVLSMPESKNSICAIDLATGKVEDLVTGADFYKSVRVFDDQIFWISYNHPNMPWNGTELWLANINQLHMAKKIAGDSDHAVAQAQWSENGDIFFAAELNNFINLYRLQNGKIENVFPRNSEFIYPDWVPGSQQYALSKNTICATYIEQGRWKIIVGTQKENRTLKNAYASVPAIHSYKDHFVALVDHADKPATIVAIYPNGEVKEIYSPKQTELSTDFISIAEEIQFPTDDGSVGYSWYYGPKNPNYSGPAYEKPPLLTFAHGGPTAMSTANFRKIIQFWTSRGYAVVDVNYGGSTGYGKKYRERLRGKWGLVDVNDCVCAVKQLAARNLIDPKRVAIRGGSAGGYTTLAALAFTKNIFSVGASYFGVSDLQLLAKETHKLESRYLDQLVGPYPEAIEVYKARAPLEHIDQFSCPIIFFQGDEDKVVPPNQSELMHASLKKKGIPTEYYLYEKEGHGFRRAETNQNALKAEHAFYARFFKFEIQPEDRL